MFTFTSTSTCTSFCIRISRYSRRFKLLHSIYRTLFL